MFDLIIYFFFNDGSYEQIDYVKDIQTHSACVQILEGRSFELVNLINGKKDLKKYKIYCVKQNSI